MSSRSITVMALAGALLVAGLAAAGPAQARTCTLSTEGYQSLGPTYVFPYKVKGVSCKKGKRVIRAFHKCRYAKPKAGLRGRCKSRVKGFRCKEGKRSGIKGVQYDANVTCKRGGARVRHHYQQSY